jgi:hypothetical protein
MSKPKVKSDNLHSLQKLIVLHLAENEPQTMNQTAEAISKSYKPSWIAFNSLEKKRLIGKADILDYRGRKYPRYWLTDEGMIMALMEGASSNKLLERTKILYPDAKIMHCFLEIMPFFDPEVIRMAYSNVKGKGKLGFIEVATLILSEAAMPMDIETGKKVATILREYPDEYAQLKMVVQEMINQLSQLIAD